MAPKVSAKKLSPEESLHLVSDLRQQLAAEAKEAADAPWRRYAELLAKAVEGLDPHEASELAAVVLKLNVAETDVLEHAAQVRQWYSALRTIDSAEKLKAAWIDARRNFDEFETNFRAQRIALMSRLYELQSVWHGVEGALRRVSDTSRLIPDIARNLPSPRSVDRSGLPDAIYFSEGLAGLDLRRQHSEAMLVGNERARAAEL